MTLSNAYKALADAEKSVRDNINITVKNGKKALILLRMISHMSIIPLMF